MFELPEWRVWRASMEDVTDFVEAIHIQLADEGGDVGVLEVGAASHQ